MAWTSTELTKFTVGAGTFFFFPTELRYLGMTEVAANQVTQESESGELKILQLDTNIRRTATWAIDRMPGGSRTFYDVVTAGNITVSGMTALRSMITSASYCEYRMNTVSLWLPGTLKSGSADGTYRFTANSFVVPIVRKNNVGSTSSDDWRYGDGSQTISFRQEI